MQAFVTGAGRGIGLELVRQLAARGDTVHAGAREPDTAFALREIAGVIVHKLDVSDGASVAALAAELTGVPFDLVINNAGTYGGTKQSIERGLDFDEIVRTFETNALGALRVSLALLPNLKAGTGKKLAHITSGMSSISDNGSGGFYGYRMSKAALNMMAKSLAVDLKPDKILSIVVNPGWVQTDMGGSGAPTPVTESARGILQAIDTATLKDTGEFLDYKGGRYAW